MHVSIEWIYFGKYPLPEKKIELTLVNLIKYKMFGLRKQSCNFESIFPLCHLIKACSSLILLIELQILWGIDCIFILLTACVCRGASCLAR